MPDDKLQKQQDKLTRQKTFGIPKLHQRLGQPIKQANDPLTRPNRIAAMLDVSGSMAGSADRDTQSKIARLREAMQSFITTCNFADTSLAIETFGDSNPHVSALSCFQPLLLTSVMSLDAVGGTPLDEAMDFVINTYSITRGVIVSDGCANRPDSCIALARNYSEAHIPLDCVHIGSETNGESLLAQIAELTGGLFIKFKDVASFGKNFKYLTPAYRAMLTANNSAAARLLGAEEVK